MSPAVQPIESSQGQSALGTITPWGWLVITGVVITFVPGWLWGWAEFRILWVMAAVAVVVAVVSILRRGDHRAELVLDRPRVVVGDVATGNAQIYAAGDRPSSSATLELPIDDAVASFHVGALVPGQRHIEPFTIPATTRGVMQIGPLRSVQTDPLVLASRSKQLSEAIELFVHPQVVLIEAGAIGFLRDVEGIATSNLSSSDVTFHTLREYQPGDDRRSVHWRTTARTGTLMVRQFEETMRAHLLILLSTLQSDYDSPQDFELAVSVAGSLGVSALRQERQVTLCTSAGLVNFRGAIGLLDRLAGVQLSAKGGDLRQLVLRHAGEPGISVAAFVTGTTDPAKLRAAQLALSPGIMAFAMRCQGEASLARRRVGDLVISDLSRLDDLQTIVASLT